MWTKLGDEPICKCVVQCGMLCNDCSPAFMRCICCSVSVERSWPCGSGNRNRSSSKFKQNPAPYWRHCRQSCCPASSSLPHPDTNIHENKVCPSHLSTCTSPTVGCARGVLLVLFISHWLGTCPVPLSGFTHPEDEGSTLFQDVRTDLHYIM